MVCWQEVFLRFVSFSSLLAVLVMFRLISDAIRENSERGWCCTLVAEDLGEGEDNNARLSKVEDVC
jgi:hypothetical protein